MITLDNTQKIYSYAFFSKMLFELVIWMIFLRQMGWSIIEIGMLQAIVNFTQFFTEIPSGYMADRFGRKKTIAVGQVLIIIYVLTFFAATSQHWLVYLGFFLYGLGLSLISGADQSLIYDNIKSTTYASVFGRYNAIAIMAIAVSSLLGGYISNVSWSWVFILTAIMQVVALVVILNFEETHTVSEHAQVNGLSFFRNVWQYVYKNPAYIYLMIAIGLTQGTISILYQYGSLFLMEFHFGPADIAKVFFAIAVLSAVASFKIDKIIAHDNANTVILRMFIMALLTISLLMLNTAWIAVFVFVGLNILFEIWDTTLNTVLQDAVISSQRTTMVSFVNQLTALLMGIESILIGVLSQYWTMNLIFIVFGGTTLVAGIIFFSMYVLHQQNKN